jgi:hypothetical protein
MTDVEKLVLAKPDAVSEDEGYQNFMVACSRQLIDELFDEQLSEMEARADMLHDEVFAVREQIEQL